MKVPFILPKNVVSRLPLILGRSKEISNISVTNSKALKRLPCSGFWLISVQLYICRGSTYLLAILVATEPISIQKVGNVMSYVFFALVLESVQPQDSLSILMNDVRSNVWVNTFELKALSYRTWWVERTMNYQCAGLFRTLCVQLLFILSMATCLMNKNLNLSYF